MQTTEDNVPSIDPQPASESLKVVEEPPRPSQGGGGEEEGAGGGISDLIATPPPSTTKVSEPPSTTAEESAPTVEPAPSTTHNAPAVAAPPPAVKRFSSATISKQFMQKATTGAGGVNHHSSSSASQSGKNASGGATSSNISSTAAAHPSRLVTARLTTPSAASSTGGWNTPKTSSTANPSPAQTPGLSSANNKQFPGPQNGKPAIEHRTAGKPWGEVKKSTSSTVVNPAGASEEFPTAAEVARSKPSGRAPKPPPVQVSTPEEPDNKSADAFRGVHLDPNAHHWDEDDGGDSDFLDNVLEFGDGTQYSLPPTATAERAPDFPPEGSLAVSRKDGLRRPSDASEANAPVRKEDRFVDDFDRSWPPAKGAPSLSGSSPKPLPRDVGSPAQSHPSPQYSDRDRHLFNDRSNRLEPYSTKPAWGKRDEGRAQPPHLLSRDPSHASRDRDFSSRDPPPHSAISHQTPSSAQSYGRNRPPWGDRRESGAGRHGDMPPPLPSSSSMDGPAWGRNVGRRLSNTSRDEGLGLSFTHNLPSRPGRGFESSRELNRQPPPHISGAPVRVMGPPPSPGPRRLSGRWETESSAGGPRPFVNGRRESISSNVSHSPLITTTAEAAPLVTTALPPPTESLEEVTKLAMHSAAERAKIRRQEEEATREQERERARAKAAAIEAKMKAADEERREKAAAAEREAKRVAEEQKRREEEEARVKAEGERLEQERLTLAAKEKEKAQFDPLKAKSTSTSRPRLQLLPRTVPLPPPVAATSLPDVTETRPVSLTQKSPRPPRAEDRQPSTLMTPLPGSAVSHAIHSLTEKHGDDIEEVDYADMAALMGGAPTVPVAAVLAPSQSPKVTRPERTGRPVASDFFDTSPPLPVDTDAFIADAVKDVRPTWRNVARPAAITTVAPPAPVADTTAKIPTSAVSPTQKSTVVPPSPAFSTTRSALPLSPTQLKSGFREAPLSSLSDTMARLQGVLANMHTPSTEPTDPLKRSGPPAVPVTPIDFAVTRPVDSQSIPVFEATVLKLSKQPFRPKIHHKQMQLYQRSVRPPTIMSFDPPIPYLSARTLSRDEMLIAKKTKRLVVNIAKTQSGLKVSLPSGSLPSSASRSTFGRGIGVDEASWRRPVARPEPSLRPVAEVDATSRSPPPALDDGMAVQVPTSEQAKSSLPSSPTSSRGKGKSSGPDVAFYRPPAADIQPSASVQFMVLSEIDETKAETETYEEDKSHTSEEGEKTAHETPSSQSASTLLTPPTNHATTWAKSTLGFPVSPAKIEADSERIKAVWEQTSHKGSNAENSLKDIADEFPATIPHSVQEMKSEDGDTKPDSPASLAPPAPTPMPRMSLRDAHRAFQMVPQSPAGNGGAPSYQPLSGNAAPARPMDPPTIQPGGTSPYMAARQPPMPSPNPYGVRQFPPVPNPNMLWAQPSPYMQNGNLAPRSLAPSSTGPSPPLPMWMPQQQQPQQQQPSQFPGNGSPFPPYMQGQPMQQMQPQSQHVQKPHMGAAPMTPMTPGSALPPHLPHGQPMNYPNPGSMNNMAHHHPHSQIYQARPPPQMMSPHLYHTTPPVPTGYGAPVGAGRGMPARNGFELPPPATPNHYPQLQGRPFHTPGW